MLPHDEEAARLLGTLRPDVREGVLTAMMTGRRGEILGLKRSAVDFTAQHIHLTETKTNKVRLVPIHETLVPILKQVIDRSTWSRPRPNWLPPMAVGTRPLSNSSNVRRLP